jgi:uncharacterized phiE125 gp8 family phage protein
MLGSDFYGTGIQSRGSREPHTGLGSTLGYKQRYRALEVIEHPAVEPVTLTEAKAQCRVDGTEEDSHIQMLVAAARRYVEKGQAVSLIDTRWAMRLDGFPDRIELPLGNFSPTASRGQAIIQYITADGSTAELKSGEDFSLEKFRRPAVLSPLPSASWPTCKQQDGAVCVSWWAGYGEDATKVPATYKSIILTLVATWYMHREAVSMGAAANRVPFSVEAMLAVESWGEYR